MVSYALKMSSKNEITYLKNLSMETNLADYYYWKKNKDPMLVAEGINGGYIMTSPFSAKTAFVTTDGMKYDFNLQRLGSKKQIQVLDDIMGFFSLDIENENFLLAKLGSEDSQSPDMFLIKGSAKPVVVATEMAAPAHGKASLDFNLINYITNFDYETNSGTLYQKRYLFGRQISEKEIAQNVASFTPTRDGKTLVYTTDLSPDQTASIYVYKNGKSIHIADDILQRNFKLASNGKSISYIANFSMETYSGDLFVKKLTGNGKLLQVDDNVYAMYYSRDDKNAIYFKNFDMMNNAGDLYLWKGNKAAELVDNNVSAVMFEAR